MRHLNETTKFKVSASSESFELPGVENIDTSWTARLAISGSKNWPEDNLGEIRPNTHLAFTWISNHIDFDPNPHLTVNFKFLVSLSASDRIYKKLNPKFRLI